MTLTAVPPELIGVLEASTIAREDKERINDFFAGNGMTAGNPIIATNGALAATLEDVIGIPF